MFHAYWPSCHIINQSPLEGGIKGGVKYVIGTIFPFLQYKSKPVFTSIIKLISIYTFFSENI